MDGGSNFSYDWSFQYCRNLIKWIFIYQVQKKNNFDKAILNLKKAINLQPNFDQAHNNLGNILKNTGKFEEAVNCYREALKINPKTYKKMSIQGRKHVADNYNFEKFERKWIETMDNIVEKHGSENLGHVGARAFVYGCNGFLTT